MDVKIFVCSHKDYKMPTDSMWVPVLGGASSKSIPGNFVGDNTGNNISDKNHVFNELSVLYWGWKNVKADVKGLVHYRRYIGIEKEKDNFENLITKDDVENYLSEYDIIVPYPKKFYLLNSFDNYKYSRKHMVKTHTRDLVILQNVMEKLYPEYAPALNDVYKSHSVHTLNICIMKNEDFDKYCTWLFNILFEMERTMKIRKRVLACMGEFLLEAYINTNRLKCKDLPLIELERTTTMHKILKRINYTFISNKWKNRPK